MPFGGKAPFYRFTVTDACLVSPIDDRLFFFGPFQNPWIFLLFPPLDTLRILFHGALRRTLAAYPPAFHIVGYTPAADFFPVLLFDVLSGPFQRPQFPGYPVILWSFLFDHFLDLCLFFLRQSHRCPRLSPLFFSFQGRFSLSLIRRPDFARSILSYSCQFLDLLPTFAHFLEPYDLPAYLFLPFCPYFSQIYIFHSSSISHLSLLS